MNTEVLFARLNLAAFNPAAATGDGRWRDGQGRFVSENPATGEPLAGIGRATAADCAAALEMAVAAFPRWRAVPGHGAACSCASWPTSCAAGATISARSYRSKPARSAPRASARSRR